VWPGHAFTFQRQMARFDAESYSLRGRAVMQDGSPAALPKPA
jgi:hypothetical protein